MNEHSTTFSGKAPVTLHLDGILKGCKNLYLAKGRKMRIGHSAKVLASVQAKSTLANVTFSLLQLEPGSELSYDKGL